MSSFIETHLHLVGLSAATLNSLRFIPILIEVYRTKKTNNFTYLTIFFALSAALLWLVYAYFNSSIGVAINALVATISYCYILNVKLKYK